MITHLVSPDAFDGDRAEVTGDAYRHLFRARRLATGERLRVVDGAGRARWGEVADIDARSATLTLGGPAPSHEPTYQLRLIVAPLRPERARWMVEKATELGVSSICFLEAARTPRTLAEGRIDRLRRVAEAAVAQCHRSRVPAISGVHPWDDLETLLVAYGDRFALDPDAEEGGRLVPSSIAGAVLIGPEGGWDPAEQKALLRVAQGVALGQRVLRVETAAIAAVASLLAGTG